MTSLWLDLENAIHNGDEDGVRSACKYGLNLNLLSPVSSGLTPLVMSILAGQFGITRLLVETFNVDVNPLTHREPSSLTVAISYGKHNTVKLLLEHGAVPVRCDLVCAAKAGNINTMKLLVTHGLDAIDMDVAYMSVYHDRCKIVRWLVDEMGVDLNTPYTDMNETIISLELLRLYSFDRETDMIGLLVELGCHLTKQTTNNHRCMESLTRRDVIKSIERGLSNRWTPRIGGETYNATIMSPEERHITKLIAEYTVPMVDDWIESRGLYSNK